MFAMVQLSDSSDHPPSGYVFVPKGDVYITRHWYESSKVCTNSRLTLNSRNLTSVSGRWLWIVYVRSPKSRAIHSLPLARTVKQTKDWGSTASSRSSKQSKKTLLALVRSSEGHSPLPCAGTSARHMFQKLNTSLAHCPTSRRTGLSLPWQRAPESGVLLRTLPKIRVIALRW